MDFPVSAATIAAISLDFIVLGRDEAYIGVLIDDLVTKGTIEPYRMFTSRAEYRLLLRHDNADFRLMDKGYSIGLVSENVYGRFKEKKRLLFSEIERLKKVRIKPSDEISDTLSSLGTTAISEDIALDKILKRPEIRYDFIKKFSPAPEALTPEIESLVEISVKYEGYIQRQMEMAERLKRLESKKIPANFNYKAIPGLSKEIVEKLSKIQPETIGQTSRIPGITPAAISIILVSVERHWKEKNS